MKSATVFALNLFALLFAFAGCSNVGHVYVAPGYQSLDDSAVKRIIVAGWSVDRGAAPLIARVAGDFVKLRKDYIVTETVGLTRGFEDACKDSIQGVLAVRVLESKLATRQVSLRVAAELYRCTDGALLWRAEGEGNANPADESLKEMVANYATDFGEPAKTYAAPAFVVLQDVLNALPNVKLSDKEVEEKIELGQGPFSSPGPSTYIGSS
ncbi:MAG: MXAN_6521/LA_1396 family lipoprotein [Clostridia bacterium]|nr:MXAN_6521/LA_1396 family lipoprotein [Deltaproteobacteria bacterium]